MRKIFILPLSLFLVCIQGCKNYLIDKESAASQMTNLKIEKRVVSDIIVSTAGCPNYHNNLKYLIIKNQSLNTDTINPFDIKFFLKSGINSGWWGTSRLIFKEGYFITFSDTTLKTVPKCKFCKINIDSIEKILIRGPRLNKK